MATKKGILSDANNMKNCLDYKALPVGFANAEFIGSTSNPFLTGIKTPKYQRSAPKPASADVVAVNNSAMYGGNKFVNARKILDQYQKEARDFKPPPINPETLDPYEFQMMTGEEGLFLNTGEEARERYLEILEQQRTGVRTRMKTEKEDRERMITQVRQRIAEKEKKTQVATILQRTFRGNRGDKITKQTISSQSDRPLTEALYKQFYELGGADRQKGVSRKIYSILLKQGITPEDYGVSYTEIGTTGDAKKRADQTIRMVEAILARGGDASLALSMLNPLSQLPSKKPSSSVSSTSVAGTSTEMSQALTLQGTPEPATSSTPVEVQKE
jgi:hypothetical protein